MRNFKAMSALVATLFLCLVYLGVRELSKVQAPIPSPVAQAPQVLVY